MKRLLLIVVAMCAVLVGRAPLSAQRGTASTPQRIISLVPATTEMLFDMGAGGRMVGVGSYDRFPPEVETLPRLCGLLDPNIEQLIALRPDRFSVYETQV